MFVDFFIRRPIFAKVCALLIILAGAVSIPTLPVAQLPDLAPGKAAVIVGGNASHGVAVTGNNATLIVNSRLNSAVYKYSLPDLKLTGAIDIAGIDPNWVTLTPDGKTAYVAVAGSNFVSAIDIASMKQVARIAVGQVPKRNITALLQ